MIDFPFDCIALYKTIDEVLPYKQYNSGAKDQDNSEYNNKNVNTNRIVK